MEYVMSKEEQDVLVKHIEDLQVRAKKVDAKGKIPDVSELPLS